MLAKNGRRVRISSRHSFAICEEIGERLRTILCCTETELPPRLRVDLGHDRRPTQCSRDGSVAGILRRGRCFETDAAEFFGRSLERAEIKDDWLRDNAGVNDHMETLAKRPCAIPGVSVVLSASVT